MSAVFLPIHVWDREFDSRLVLGILLANRGKRVFIGHEYNIAPLYGKEDRQALFRAGSATKNYRGNWDKKITEANGIAVTQDEEGINKVPLKFTADNRNNIYTTLDKTAIHSFLNHSPIEAVQATSYQLAWGKLHKKFIEETYTDHITRKHAENIQVIEKSSIRFDLLGNIGAAINAKTINSLDTIFKTYILVVDNFTIDQGRDGQGIHDPSNDMRAEGRTEKEIKEFLEKIKSERILETNARNSFSKIIFKLSERFPEVQFIIRPHPVHPREYWHRTFAENKNIDILSSGCVHPWIYAAACTIHSGCTTGLEAFAASTENFDISELIDQRPEYVTNSTVYHSKDKPKTFTELANQISEAIKKHIHSKGSTSNDSVELNLGKHNPNQIALVKDLFANNAHKTQDSICSRLNITNASDLIGNDSSINFLLDKFANHSHENEQHNTDALRQMIGRYPINMGKSRSISFTEFKNRTQEIIDGLRGLGINIRVLKCRLIGVNVFVIDAKI